jgi:precorrin-3B synthase
MPSGDGLIVRVRPQSGALGCDELMALAEAAGRFGNGHIDLTRRANLQIRGVSEASVPPLHDVIASLGLLDDNPDGEAVRNVMVNPLAGIDPSEVLDIRNIARELTRRLETEPSLWALPTKFGFIVDGGGVLGLAAQRADIRLTAIANAPDVAIAVGVDTRDGIDWLGAVSPASAADVAIEIAHVFLEETSHETRHRMRDLSTTNFASLKSTVGSRLNPLVVDMPATSRSQARRVGLLSLGLDRFAAGITAPFGRAETDQLRKFADAMTGIGIREIRLSPWRTLYARAPSQQAAASSRHRRARRFCGRRKRSLAADRGLPRRACLPIDLARYPWRCASHCRTAVPVSLRRNGSCLRLRQGLRQIRNRRSRTGRV